MVRIVFLKGKFKSVNLTNSTLQLIIYPEDGLKAAVKLQELQEGEPILIDINTGD